MSECIVAGEGLFAYVRFVCRILSVWNAKKKTQNYISWWDLVVEVEEPWFFIFGKLSSRASKKKIETIFVIEKTRGKRERVVRITNAYERMLSSTCVSMLCMA